MRFQLQKSYLLCTIFLLIHIGSIFCIYFTALVLWEKVLLIFCVLIHFILKKSQSICEFWQSDSGEWYVKNSSEDAKQVLLNYPIFISNKLIVLKFSKIPVLITRDSLLVKDDFRKLKVLLKMQSFPLKKRV